MKNNVRQALAMLTLTIGAGEASAAGFALSEQNASGLGNAFSGQAAAAEDASTIFFNPAGLSFLPGAQVSLGASYIKPSIEFSNNGSSSQPPLITSPSDNGGNAGKDVVVPNIYLAIPIGNFSLGLGVGAPFGLQDEYDSNFIGRFQAIKSDLTTYNVNPTLAWKITPRFSVGAGVNYQHIDVELTNSVVGGLNTEFTGRVKGNDDAWGWNVGAMLQASDDLRVGASYRSRISYTVDGSLTVDNPPAGTNTPIHADLTVPDTASISAFQRFDDKWDLLGDITWTHWSVIDAIDIVSNSSGATVQSLKLALENSWRISFGLNYHLSNAWTLKGGFAWDQSPVKDQFRGERLPDADRYWLSIGAKWRPLNSFWVDVGYAHLFVKDAPINQTQTGMSPPLTTNTVAGSYDNSVDILGVQLTYQF